MGKKQLVKDFLSSGISVPSGVTPEELAKWFHERTERIVAQYRAAALQALEWQAQDVRNEARRSIKSGGKNERSKNWQTSKPGEAPRSHIGTLKRSIRYEKKDESSYVVGAPALGASQLPKTLEQGGVGSKTTATFVDSYFKRRFGRARKTSGSRPYPKASRPYRVYSQSKPSGKLIRDYLFFHSADAWEKARNSSRFQTWARSVRTIATLRFPVAPRPFIGPAWKVQSDPQKMEKRAARALKYVTKAK